MKISQLHTIFTLAMTTGKSVYLKSQPGIGKTESVRQFAESIGRRLIHVHVPLTDLLDIKGVISTNGDTAKFLPLAVWPKPDDEPVVVLLDELPQAAPAIINGYSQLLIDQQMGDIQLPKGSLVIATGNRKEDKAAANNLPTHVVSRVMHIDLELSIEEFLNYAAKNRWNQKIVGYLTFKNSSINTFDPKDSQSPYGCPRTWECASQLLNAAEAADVTDMNFDLLASEVGEHLAGEVISYCRLYEDLQNPADVLAAPKLATLPSNHSALIALSLSIAAIVDKKTVTQFYEYLERLDKELRIMTIKTAKRYYNDVTKDDRKSFSKFAVEHSELFLD